MENKEMAGKLTPPSNAACEETLIAENLKKEEPIPISENTKEIPIATKNEKEDMGAPISSTTRKGPLDGWTKDEKYELYMGIKSKGSKRIHEIQKILPTKTIEEIQAAISYYMDKVNDNPECVTKKLKARRVRTKPLIPLASWAKALTDNLNYEDLQTEMITALRLIADLEDMPHPVLTEQINFRKVYHQIANAMEGKALIDDRFVMEVLNSCILDTALVSKNYIKPSIYRNILNAVSFNAEKEVPVFPRPTANIEVAIIRHLIALKNYNPLGISEEYLKAAASQPATVINM